MSPDTVAGKGGSRALWVGYGAFAWALLFSATYVYWALGGTVLLGKYQDQSAETLLTQDPRIYVAEQTLLQHAAVAGGIRFFVRRPPNRPT